MRGAGGQEGGGRVWPLLVVVDLEVCGLAARCTCTHAVRMQQCTYAMHMPACTCTCSAHVPRQRHMPRFTCMSPPYIRRGKETLPGGECLLQLSVNFRLNERPITTTGAVINPLTASGKILTQGGILRSSTCGERARPLPPRPSPPPLSPNPAQSGVRGAGRAG